MILLGFALGQNNFGRGRARMSELVEEIERQLPSSCRFVVYFGASGNVAVEAPTAEAVRPALRAASGRDWAVLSQDPVARALGDLGPVREEDGVRWTPGLAFRLDDGEIVPVVKRDAMDGHRLDAAKRDGGWGAVSAEVAREHGGRWTARSWSRVAGLLERV
jgi:hypothetical protein